MPSCGPDTKGSLQKGTRPTEAYKWDSEVELNSQVNLWRNDYFLLFSLETTNTSNPIIDLDLAIGIVSTHWLYYPLATSNR